MKPLGLHNYFVYILTNRNRNVLYVGVTNDLERRLYEHQEKDQYQNMSFSSKYKTFYLIYWERFENIEDAIMREKQIKGWTRAKKETLISEFNPEWKFLNDEIS
ncbi:GIY-YIG nuclease family protein [Dysgonomonas sp. 520]|uniref:GIY-YIG nuclease family protein n=1 Tax=Dysgonomonas sp. 520 TaxID=2302931 RepID=UPI0013D2E491|nr:GIY-YIG nuclease family protein [Dysgonomonas sp. 520]NDW08819.1 GIY-YIG nuclease family protein [Dysgonomonas sp. 520]